MMGMMTSEPAMLPVALAELKAFLRVSVSDEDALLAAQLRAAAALCEAFTGRVLMEQDVLELVPASTGRIRLGAAPVRAVESVAAMDDAGNLEELAAEAFSAEIDAGGEAWIVLHRPTRRRLQVSYRAGLAADWNGVPEMLRHGIVRLAAQYYVQRGEAPDGAPPAAVTALWRPWRRLSIGGGQSGTPKRDQADVRAM